MRFRIPKPRKELRVRDDDKNIYTVEEYIHDIWDELRTELHRTVIDMNIYFIHEKDCLMWTAFLRNVSWGRCSVIGVNPGGGINAYLNIERLRILTNEELNLYVYNFLPTTSIKNVRHKFGENLNARTYWDKVMFLEEGYIPPSQMHLWGFNRFLIQS